MRPGVARRKRVDVVDVKALVEFNVGRVLVVRGEQATAGCQTSDEPYPDERRHEPPATEEQFVHWHLPR